MPIRKFTGRHKKVNGNVLADCGGNHTLNNEASGIRHQRREKVSVGSSD